MRCVLFRPIRDVTLGCLVIMTLQGVTFAQQDRVKPVQQMVIEDGRGKTLGRVLGGVTIDNIEPFGSTNLIMRTYVLLQVDKTLVPVIVGRNRFYGGAGLLYESENCMGTPFLNPAMPEVEIDAPSLLPLTAIGPPGQTLYMAVPGTALRAIVKKSVLEFGLRCINETGNISNAIPTQPLIDLLTEFTPPFSLKAAP